MAASLGEIHYTQVTLDEDGTLHAVAECWNCGATNGGDDADEIDVWIIHHHSSGCGDSDD